ncbi:MAG: hypothetical protein PHQ74_06065 [Crocinitomicaceae bacterium]|nr:hypothetical protein [Crocinitomicaceae bacterium]
MKFFKIALIPFSLVMLFSCGGDKPDFKGHIVYEINAQKKDAGIPDEFLSSIGDGSTFYYEDGSYFQTHTNSVVEFGYLDLKAKQVGMKYADNDTLFVTDASKKPTEELVKTESKLTNKEVLGYMCNRFDVLTKNTEFGYEESMVFYYSNQLKIDGQKFKGIKYQFYNVIYNKMNSLPLSFEIDNPVFSVQYIAKKVVKKNTVSVSDLIETSTKGLIVKQMN